MRIKVYYWKDIRHMTMVNFDGGTPSAEDIAKTYTLVYDHEVPVALTDDAICEQLFSLFNQKDMIGQDVARKAGHTSMSIGDIVDLDGKYYICRSFGFDRYEDEDRLIELLNKTTPTRVRVSKNTSRSDSELSRIWKEAWKAGDDAGKGASVTPMVVYEAGLFDDKPLPGGQSWFVDDGVCGFAWVDIRPASHAGRSDCDLVKWMRSRDIGHYSEYHKSWQYSINEFNQSMQRKEAAARAIADVLTKYGYRAYDNSRMD